MTVNAYYLPLQFFAAENEGKTEKATSKKREDARKKGQVAKSTELNTAVIIIGFCALMVLFGGYMLETIELNLARSIRVIPDVLSRNDNQYLLILLSEAIVNIVITCIPLWMGLFIMAFGISYVQVGYKPTFEPLQPKFSKMNPLTGIKKIISKDMLVTLVLALGKVTLLGTIIFNVIKSQIPIFLNFYDFTPAQVLINICSTIIRIGFFAGGAFTILAVVDYLYQKYKYEDSIKMTKQEVKEEYKNAEGDPQIKGKIRQKMREGSLKRMMQSVPQADVIITNPTHFAIAIQYEPNKNTAPIVVAKGVDYVAQKIKEKAKEHHIHIVENKPLARTLYYTVDIDKEIPQELYGAIAEVLALVYSLEDKKANRRRK
ncbi:flagellar biosynthesis protein FlhB [Cellulosilyticum sp. I15G10I2]|uniref:flagellar biosynthesis protein FlhB n=1 Tax=Cellulosilyticum sp. I15G10I2 TaxID=1892843 RepID=UPI00085BDF86|nr:flagellar biosynthesis protein FlhB [Cellulosilyticum sp. I15G10I2]